jgi:predicted MPP superfamily phosphohydrolase
MKTTTVIIGLVALCGALIAYSWKIEPGLLQTKTVEITAPSINKNCTIAFMADLHIPLVNGLEDKILAALRRNKPDIILIGGDFSANRTEASYAIDKLKLLSRYGKVVMVLGNTDLCGLRQCVYCALKYPVDRLALLPAALLRNDSIVLPDLGIKVVGLDDPVTGKDDTLAMPPGAGGPYFNILLLHNNSKLTDNQKRRFNLICSGHTHGGQLFFLKPFLHAFDPTIDQRFINGLYTMNNTTLMVTSGIGESFLPLRLGVVPEIVVFHLRKRI